MSALVVNGVALEDMQANPTEVADEPERLFDADTSRGVRWSWVPAYAHWNGFATGFDYAEYKISFSAPSTIGRVEVHPFDRQYLGHEGWKCGPDNITVNGVAIALPVSYRKADTALAITGASEVTVRIEGSFGFTRGNVHQRVVALNGILFYP